MNYFISIKEHIDFNKLMIIFFIAWAVFRFIFLLYDSIITINSFIFQYFKPDMFLSLINKLFSMIISIIWLRFILRIIAYVDYNLPLLMHSYVPRFVCLCSVPWSCAVKIASNFF